MDGRILYCGDTNLQTAAAYLAGVMHHAGWEFDYVPSDRALAEEMLHSPRSLYILSDYPAENVDDALQRRIVDDVENGGGLIMIGGWESFHGTGGDWDGTPIGETLPVIISSSDDRVNCDRPVLVARVSDHPAVDGLPWDDRPPVIGGFNRVTAKADAEVLVEARHFSARRTDDRFEFQPAGSDPLLIVGRHGRGPVAALMTDVAPHWVGPLVDWGDGRIAARARQAGDVEVGDLYARFLRQLLSWLRSGRDPTPPVSHSAAK